MDPFSGDWHRMNLAFQRSIPNGVPDRLVLALKRSTLGTLSTILSFAQRNRIPRDDNSAGKTADATCAAVALYTLSIILRRTSLLPRTHSRIKDKLATHEYDVREWLEFLCKTCTKTGEDHNQDLVLYYVPVASIYNIYLYGLRRIEMSQQWLTPGIPFLPFWIKQVNNKDLVKLWSPSCLLGAVLAKDDNSSIMRSIDTRPNQVALAMLGYLRQVSDQHPLDCDRVGQELRLLSALLFLSEATSWVFIKQGLPMLITRLFVEIVDIATNPFLSLSCALIVLNSMQSDENSASWISMVIDLGFLPALRKSFHKWDEKEQDAVRSLFNDMIPPALAYYKVFRAVTKQLSQMGTLHPKSVRKDCVFVWLITMRTWYAEAAHNLFVKHCSNRACPYPDERCHRRCNGCDSTYYCSRTCQKADWNDSGHRLICKRSQALVKSESLVSLSFTPLDAKFLLGVVREVLWAYQEQIVAEWRKDPPSEPTLEINLARVPPKWAITRDGTDTLKTYDLTRREVVLIRIVVPRGQDCALLRAVLVPACGPSTAPLPWLERLIATLEGEFVMHYCLD